MKLIIGNCNYSSWSLRPWLFLRHHEITFETQRISLFTDSMEHEMASFFSDNKVPVLQDDGLEVWDSLAILEYLAERYPEKGGWPQDSRPRAVARSVSAVARESGLWRDPARCRATAFPSSTSDRPAAP